MDGTIWGEWGLKFARAAGVLALAPPLGGREFAWPLRLGVAAWLAAAFSVTSAGSQALPGGAAYVAAIARETAIGLLLGSGLALIVGAIWAAGHLQDIVGGWSFGEGEEGPLMRLGTLLAAVFFVQAGGLQALVRLLGQSWTFCPPGQGLRLLERADWLCWPTAFFGALLAVAGPVVLATLLASLFVSSLHRVTPALPTAEVMPAARALITLLALAAAGPVVTALVLEYMNTALMQAIQWLAGAR